MMGRDFKGGDPQPRRRDAGKPGFEPQIGTRAWVTLGLIFLAFVYMGWRAFDLQVFQAGFLREQGAQRYLREVPMPTLRGAIHDRNGEPLALSTPMRSIWVNPKEFRRSRERWPELARVLGMNPAKLARLVRNDHATFVYIKRQIPPSLAEQVAQLDIPGVYALKESRRYYPTGEVTGHLLGFTNVDDHGLEGIELAYNDWLQGQPGKMLAIRDNIGRRVTNLAMLQPVKPGRELTLSIDKRIQYLTYRELKAAVQKFQAKSASAVVMDVRTGEILAMASQQGFNPNNRAGSTPKDWRNRAIADAYEPGSTIKPFTVAAALEAGVIRPNSTFNCGYKYYPVGNARIRDDHPHGVLDVSQIILYSSNIGAAQIALKTPPEKFYEMLSGAGFGQLSGSGLPSESPGSLPAYQGWGLVERATLAFGYGLSANALQLAGAYAAIANGGIYLRPTLFRVADPASVRGQRIMKEQTAAVLRQMLEGVISPEGTGTLAGIPGYRVAGKTGTAHKASRGGYANNYVASFVGFAPASDPRLVMAVMVNEPKGQYYGGLVAAPVFRQVMAGSLRLLNVSPDAAAPLLLEGPQPALKEVKAKPKPKLVNVEDRAREGQWPQQG
ncbi:MAG: peptidoglycan D,D-transpeptidase FtsI family protein [Pseudomonadota bacterium]|uniref:peptidoglycan D,D-transpeptidase FtsI family protein n=1 Tax=Thermithiobacillus tepidarius TaxID=929 RepID=UPI0003F9E78C|nr:penicillin-binding protein 2 [Thermithiobacillus tepidarius]